MFIKGEEGKKGKKKIVIIAVLIAAAAGTAAVWPFITKTKGIRKRTHRKHMKLQCHWG